MALYAYAKLAIMLDRGDTTIQVNEMDRHFDSEREVTDELGFNVAFALSIYDGKSEVVEDPDYATLVAEYRRFGYEDDDDFDINMETRNCTHEDFMLNPDWSRPNIETKDELTEEE